MITIENTQECIAFPNSTPMHVNKTYFPFAFTREGIAMRLATPPFRRNGKRESDSSSSWASKASLYF